MPASILLQDWRTIRGSSGVNFFQPRDDSADLLHYKDYTLFIEVADFNNVSFALQTSPSMDEAMFVDHFAPVAVNVTGVTLIFNRYSTATLPVARYVRYRCANTIAGSWSLTARMWLAANFSGFYVKQMHKKQIEDHLKMHEQNAKQSATARTGAGG